MSTDIAIALLPSIASRRSPQEADAIPADLLNSDLAPATWAVQHLSQTIQLDPLQNQILDCPSKRIALLCSRQWGKSTVIAIKLLHFALHHPNAKIIIAANAESQSSGLLDKVKFYASQLQLRASSRKLILTLPNGSEIKAIPNSPDTVRGLSGINLLIIDEAAFVPDQHFHAIVPFLATTNGHLWLLSTANNQRGFFYDIVTSNGHAPHGNLLEPTSLRESGHANTPRPADGHASHGHFSEPTSLRESGHAASPSDASTQASPDRVGRTASATPTRMAVADPDPHDKSAQSSERNGFPSFGSGSRPVDPASATSRSDASANAAPDRVGHADPDGNNTSENARAYQFIVFLATAPDCPRITPEFLADERALKPIAQYEREYLCKFLSTRGQIFDASILGSSSNTATEGTLSPTLLFGLDIGFQQSHTALAALQLTWSYSGQDSLTLREKYQPHLKLLQLHRFPLATAHTDTWESIHNLIAHHTECLRKSGTAKPTRVLLFDYAGAGQTYHEHFRKNCKDIQVQPITITSGQTPGTSGDALTIPRQDLLNTLKVLLETRQLTIPAHLDYAKELIDELKGIKITNTHSTPDDLAIALSLAVYRARIQMANPPSGQAKGRLL